MVQDLVDLVEVRQGAESSFEFSNGNTLPLIGAPFAMCNWSLQTAGGPWFYHPQHRRLQGIRATRQPSPWIRDYGHFSFLPQLGERHLSAARRASAFRPEDTALGPDYLNVDLIRDACRIELTATERCSKSIVRFSRGGSKRLIIEPGLGQNEFFYDESRRVFSCKSSANNGGVPDNFATYIEFHISDAINLESSKAFDVQGEVIGPVIGSYKDAGVALEFQGDPTEVTIDITTSFISFEQAGNNLANEIGDRSFDEVRNSTRSDWEQLLSRVAIEGASDEQRRTFYSAMYRCFLFPRQIHELNSQGKKVHYSPYDGKVHGGPMYTDNGFWDTHRTVYPLFSILIPSILKDMLEGWINAYREGAWFPKWASPGYKACMIGTHIDAVMADAYVKGIEFDVETAFAGLCKHAYQASDGSGRHGREGLEDYMKLGWVPHDRVHESASRTMDFAYNDWCIAQIAQGIGETKKAQDLLQRSHNYKNTFDSAIGFMRGRNADGSWRDNGYSDDGFSPIEWGGPFVEGSVWQCGWAVSHDVDGLIELMGGREAFVAKLDEQMETPPNFEVGYYKSEIHEMSEMAAVDFGQYAQSNQPSHHILYLYALAGCPEKTQYWVRKTCAELYAATEDGLPGDEDNGEMSAWYVFSSMGFYPVCPGKPEYVLGSPLFSKVSVTLENGNQLVIEADNQAANHVHVSCWEINDHGHGEAVIEHNVLMDGARIRAQMKL